MKIVLTLNEAKKLSVEDFSEIIKQLQDYTTKTEEDGWLDITNNDNVYKMVVNTYIDIDVSDNNQVVECLHTYYYKKNVYIHIIIRNLLMKIN